MNVYYFVDIALWKSKVLETLQGNSFVKVLILQQRIRKKKSNPEASMLSSRILYFWLTVYLETAWSSSEQMLAFIPFHFSHQKSI